ncbi:hypothetical protein D5H75_36110 [Bailinhaonella thermotolerans]|uniref:Glycosyltransferase family 1 protein n=2 Tax=Bailinhaonella thermotolerans TaxID=1070861 RepID=A0A3A4A0W9_9ACTN|nr:hypothetical protein D5H75_36110 [Bailinhaonella thermotolerans]
MKIGYSFWGFLGDGITDTPDGGRSHRRTLIDALTALGHQVVFLQKNRDLDEAGQDLTFAYTWERGLPDIDVLMLEYRWTVPSRNDTPCGSPGHTCDLHRQAELIDHYTAAGLPTIVWDKDLQLPLGDDLRRVPHVRLCEAALHPRPGATRLLFPIRDGRLDAADPCVLAGKERDLPLIYVGNQYDRDEQFDRYFAPAAHQVRHVVAGKWRETSRWPHVTFSGRIPFREVEALHRRTVTTVQLRPDRYVQCGQFTQRIFEAVLAGCLPLTPAPAPGVDQVVPRGLQVNDGHEVIEKVMALTRACGSDTHSELIADCLQRLDVFRISRQLDTLTALLGGHDSD